MIKRLTQNITQWARSLGRRNLIILAVFCLLIAAIAYNLLKKEEIAPNPISSVRAVSVSPVSLLSGDTSTLSLLGTVTSVSEATVRGESSGRITLYKKLGDYVPAGGVIGEFENSAERAAVLVAEGAYDAALAQKSIASISRGSSQTSLDEAKTGARNAVDNAKIAARDAVRTKTDPLFSNPGERDAHFVIQSANSRLVMEVEEERTRLDGILAKDVRTDNLTGKDDLTTALNSSEQEMRVIADYLDDITLVLGDAIPDTRNPQSAIDGYKSSISGARQAVSGSLSAIVAARSALSGASAAANIAEETSGAAQRVSVTDAALKSAFGNLEAARARLNKTVIRSPISGTINALPVETGDFVSPFAEIAVVANNGALEVLSYASDDDARLLSVGTKVAIQGGASGVITRIAPAIDPLTKKIEIRIGIVTGGSTLVNGQSVRIDAVRRVTGASKGPLTIPLSALKITPEGSVVFTVSTSSTVVGHAIKTGTLLGNKIVVTEGVTPEMVIVVDARGLKDGMTVTTTD